MRTIIAALVILVSFGGCKKSDPQMRLLNNNTVIIHSLQVGPLDYQEVFPGTSSAYFVIPAGKHAFSGNTSKGLLSGEINLSDEVDHYTLSLDEDNILRLTQDQ